MQQKIPRRIAALLNASAITIGGLGIHAATIGVVVNTGAVLTAERNGLVLTNNNFEAGRTTLKNRYIALNSTMAEAKVFTTLVRELIKPQLGPRYSQGWDQAGFVGKLAIPRTPAKLSPLLLSLGAYLTANVGFQNTDLNITPARALELEQLLVNDQTAVNLEITEVQRLKELRDDAARTLRNRMCALVEEVGRRIDSMDERWLALGFNRPGQKKRPPTPQKLVHVLVGNNAVSVKWEASARAEYYRVWKRVLGSDDALVPVGSPADLNYIIEGLPSTSDVEIAVSAVNNGGESALSDVIKIKTL